LVGYRRPNLWPVARRGCCAPEGAPSKLSKVKDDSYQLVLCITCVEFYMIQSAGALRVEQSASSSRLDADPPPLGPRGRGLKNPRIQREVTNESEKASLEILAPPCLEAVAVLHSAVAEFTASPCKMEITSQVGASAAQALSLGGVRKEEAAPKQISPSAEEGGSRAVIDPFN
ncbi:unnamed protein product, partial [Pleuronectes platessa]